MAPYFGLTGRKLHAAIWTEGLVAITIFGYDSASAGGVLNMPAFRTQFPAIDVTDASDAEKHYKSTIQGTVVATYVLLGVFGALACTFFGDVLGRRRTIFTAAATQLIGAILMASSFSLAQFIVGRVFIGLGVGGLVTTIPIWQSELSSSKSRGGHVSSFGIYCGSGLSLALWISFGMSFTEGDVAWRVPLGGSGVLSLIVMATIFLLPESPRWLKLKDRHDEARRILDILHPNQRAEVDKEIDDIDLALRLSAGHGRMRDMFSMGPQRIFHRVMLGCVVQLMLQFTGVNSIAYYTPTIYEDSLGFPGVEAGALAAASQACIILGGIICSFTVDRFGRRVLMMVSAAGMSVCLICVTGLTSTDNPAALKGAVFFLFMYYVMYTLGWIGIPFLYASECAPLQLRAAVCGLSTTVSWLFNYLVVEVTPVGFADIGYQYFIIYACTCASYIPIVYFFFPETSGRSLEEIDGIFTASRSIFDAVSVAKNLPKAHLAELSTVREKIEEVEQREDEAEHKEDEQKEEC